MSALFSPLEVGSLELANRIVIAPMCQYSAEDGCMTDWHVIHLGHLALSGAALLTIEATAVTPEGRISYGDTGLWSDENEEAMARVLESVRRWSDMPIAIQLAHAGRKASTEKPWKGGAQIAPGEPNGWQTVAPSPLPFMEGENPPLALDRAGLRSHPRRVRRRRAGARAARPRRRADPRRARLSAAPVPLAAVEPARRRIWRQPREPHALPARSVRRGARRVPGGAAGHHARLRRPTGSRAAGTSSRPSRSRRRSKRAAAPRSTCRAAASTRAQEIPVGPSYQVPLARAVKRAVGMPVVAVGLITEFEQAEAIVGTGDADLIALARGILYDPRWPWHAAAATRRHR